VFFSRSNTFLLDSFGLLLRWMTFNANVRFQLRATDSIDIARGSTKRQLPDYIDLPLRPNGGLTPVEVCRAH